MEQMEKFDAPKKLEELGALYPISYNYGSRCSVFGDALRDGKITREEYNIAREYYGRLWDYVGD